MASNQNLLKHMIAYSKRNKKLETALYNAVSANLLYKDIIARLIPFGKVESKNNVQSS